jgi:hypothetical protein
VRAGVAKVEMLERSNKELSGQMKAMKERIEEEKLGFENAVKRVEIREMSCK